MTRRTPLHAEHLAAGGKLVDFAGWEMPINYGSQIEEHHQVRRAAGVFDVSHMTIVDLAGERCRAFLQHLLANDVAKLTTPGKALYSCMLNEQGGIIDDLITYYVDDTHFRMVVNAATRDQDLAWIQRHAQAFGVEVSERPDLAMLAVQGPQARDIVLGMLPEAPRAGLAAMKPFFGQAVSGLEGWFLARTGYTGEDGFELMLPADQAVALWRQLLAQGVRPIGLGARDTLRLEAGMHLYGNDMNEDTTPLAVGLAWTVAMKDNRDFIGRAALETQMTRGIPTKQVGLVLLDKGVLRAHMAVTTPAGAGEVTSGSMAPTLGRSIGLALVPSDTAGDEVSVEVRGRALRARIVKPPFVRHGQALV